jgi:uncharacterized protein
VRGFVPTAAFCIKLMQPAPVDALTDADCERLEEMLVATRARLTRLDAVQGLCVAIAMGPDAPITPRWIDAVLGDESPRADDASLIELLERFRASTANALANGTLLLRAHRTRTGRYDYAGWCGGFLDGVDLSQTDWFAAADPEELDELLFPIEALADALPERERAAYKPNQWRKLVREAEDTLGDSVARLADYWAIVRAPPATIRREQPKVGRNDPCPCGSGRKFKQCHGRT